MTAGTADTSRVSEYPSSLRPEAGQDSLIFDLRSHPLMQQVEIINDSQDVDGLIECWVPRNLIADEKVKIGKERLDEKVEQILERRNAGLGTGQITPLRVALLEDGDEFKIIDGFHRYAALSEIGEDRIMCKVEAITLEKLIDERIRSTPHKDVMFSRMVQWVREAWELSGYSHLLSVSEAVTMAGYINNVENFKGSDEDAVGVRDWIAQKEKIWGKGKELSKIKSWLELARYISPGLVYTSAPRVPGEPYESPSRTVLGIFKKEIPSYMAGNNELQELVNQLAIDNDLDDATIREVCKTLRRYPTTEEAVAAAATMTWTRVERPAPKPGPGRSAEKGRASRNIGRSGAAVVEIAANMAGLKTLLTGTDRIAGLTRKLFDTDSKESRAMTTEEAQSMAFDIWLAAAQLVRELQREPGTPADPEVEIDIEVEVEEGDGAMSYKEKDAVRKMKNDHPGIVSHLRWLESTLIVISKDKSDRTLEQDKAVKRQAALRSVLVHIGKGTVTTTEKAEGVCNEFATVVPLPKNIEYFMKAKGMSLAQTIIIAEKSEAAHAKMFPNA